MASGAHCKGLTLVAAVTAIKSDPEAYEELLPADLLHYLNEDIAPGDWYPAADLVVLLKALAKVVMPESTEEEAFEYFGLLSARRDLTGEQDQVRKSRRSTVEGAYIGAMDSHKQLHTMLRHAAGLWMLYWDCGELILERAADFTVRFRLVDFPLVSQELCWLNTGFYKELGKIVGIDYDVVKRSCRSHGDEFCAWDMIFPDGFETAAFDTLPPPP